MPAGRAARNRLPSAACGVHHCGTRRCTSDYPAVAAEGEIPVPREPGGDIPPEGPIPDPPEAPPGHEPDWRTPGTEDVPIREPGDNPDVETEL